MKQVKFPFPMSAAIDNEERFAQMKANMALGIPRFFANPAVRMRRPLDVVCFGPSLHDTWQRVRDEQRLVPGDRIMTCSGALDFMVRRGVEPQFHVDMDPREHKIAGLRSAPMNTEYIMASVCHPRMLEKLKGHDVKLWHFYNGQESVDWVNANDPGEKVFLGGSTVGLAAVMLGIQMGFSKFRIFGMDASFHDGMRHAGPHLGRPHDIVKVDLPNGQTFDSSQIMVNGAAEVVHWLINLPQHRFEFHGGGLLQALVAGTNQPHMTVVP